MPVNMMTANDVLAVLSISCEHPTYALYLLTRLPGEYYCLCFADDKTDSQTS